MSIDNMKKPIKADLLSELTFGIGYLSNSYAHHIGLSTDELFCNWTEGQLDDTCFSEQHAVFYGGAAALEGIIRFIKGGNTEAALLLTEMLHEALLTNHITSCRIGRVCPIGSFD